MSKELQSRINVLQEQYLKKKRKRRTRKKIFNFRKRDEKYTTKSKHVKNK